MSAAPTTSPRAMRPASAWPPSARPRRQARRGADSRADPHHQVPRVAGGRSFCPQRSKVRPLWLLVHGMVYAASAATDFDGLHGGETAVNASKVFWRGVVCALAGATLWGFSGACIQFLAESYEVSSAFISAVRAGVAALLFAVFVFVTRREALLSLLGSPAAVRRSFCSVWGCTSRRSPTRCRSPSLTPARLRCSRPPARCSSCLSPASERAVCRASPTLSG